MNIPWLTPLAERWRAQRRQGRAPHAVLLLGAAGSGKRCAAAWLADGALRAAATDEEPCYPAAPLQHPDLHRLSPLPDKQAIGVDQVRGLVAELNLTSHGGGSKVAIIDPAQTMTVSAANSLLKTLEEPPGDALLILIADRNGGLPATLHSRCQRITVRLPAEPMALDWLDRLRPGANWASALRAAGGAPLAAVDALDCLEESAAMARELTAVATQAASPLDVAARWAKQEPQRVLGWMCGQVQSALRRAIAGQHDGRTADLPDSVLQRIDSRNLFCYLDVINRVRGQAAGSYNVQLTLESLLIDWAEGLATYAKGASTAGRSLMFATR